MALDELSVLALLSSANSGCVPICRLLRITLEAVVHCLGQGLACVTLTTGELACWVILRVSPVAPLIAILFILQPLLAWEKNIIITPCFPTASEEVAVVLATC